MPTVCCAIGCTHTSGNGICHLKRFPTDKKRAIVWAENVRGTKWNRKGWELLCDCHFDYSQFEKLREDGAKKLRHNAVPTFFPTHTIPLGDGLSNPVETSFAFDTQYEPMGLELLSDEGVAKLPDTVPFQFPTETLMLDEVHFEESAFELHRADGRRKLKPNAIPTIHSITTNASSKKKQTITPRVEFPFVDGGDDSIGLCTVESSKTRENKPSQTVEDYDYPLEGIFGHGAQKKRLKEVSASAFVSSLLTKEPAFELCPLDGGRKPEPGASNMTQTIVPVVRNKRKQLVKPRIELSCDEVGNEYGKEVLSLDNGKCKKSAKRKKRNKHEKSSNVTAGECANVAGQKLSVEGADAPDVEGVDFKCFVCSQVIPSKFAVLLSLPSEVSNIPLSQHVKDIAGVEWHLSSHEVVCRRCSSLLNHIDKTESELKILKCAISTCTRGKHIELGAKNSPNILKSMQVLDRFSTITDGTYNVLSLEELFLMKTDNEVVNGEDTISNRDKEAIDTIPPQGKTEELAAEICMEVVEGHELQSDKEIGILECYKEAISSEDCEGISSGSGHADKSESFPMNELEKRVGEGPGVDLANSDDCIPEAGTITENSANDVEGDQILERDPGRHVCKICSFKTVHESVMIWHLRMHMKSHRWCDFCTATVPEEESVFTLLKKTRPPFKPHKRRSNPKPPFIFPVVPVDPIPLSTVPLSSFPVSVIPLPGVTSQNPVVVISREAKAEEEGVIITESIGDHHDNDEIKVESDLSREVLIYGENLAISKISTVTKDPTAPKTLVTIPLSEGGEMQAHYVPGVRLRAVVQEDKMHTTHNMETYCGLYAPATEQLGKSGNLVTSDGAKYKECLHNSDENTVINSYSNSREPSGIASSECGHTNNEFINESSKSLRTGSMDVEEAYGEIVTETNFLDSLSSQAEAKYSGILPEIVDEATIQNTLSVSNSVAEEGIANKDVSFARSGSLGVSDLAIAYESSVAALMCQSDDSEGLLSYN